MILLARPTQVTREDSQRDKRIFQMLRQGICHSVSSARSLLAVQLFSKVQYYQSETKFEICESMSLSGLKPLQKRF